MRHFANPSFWEQYRNLPTSVQELADKSFEILKTNKSSVAALEKGRQVLWSVRVGRRHRALGVEIEEGLVWFWIGTHADYDKLVG